MLTLLHLVTYLTSISATRIYLLGISPDVFKFLHIFSELSQYKANLIQMHDHGPNQYLVHLAILKSNINRSSKQARRSIVYVNVGIQVRASEIHLLLKIEHRVVLSKSIPWSALLGVSSHPSSFIQISATEARLAVSLVLALIY